MNVRLNILSHKQRFFFLFRKQEVDALSSIQSLARKKYIFWAVWGRVLGNWDQEKTRHGVRVHAHLLEPKSRFTNGEATIAYRVTNL